MRFSLFTILLIYSTFSLAQNNQEVVDFTRIDIEISTPFNSKEVVGKGTYEFDLMARTDSVFVDAFNMSFLQVSLNDKKIKYSNSGKQLSFKAPEKLGRHQLFLQYIAKPKQTVYFVGNEDKTIDNRQVWTQGQGKYTSHWLPSFDDMNEKVEFDLTFSVPSKYTVIANGSLKNLKTVSGLKSWKFNMNKPMSSYLAAFVIGDFSKKQIASTSGVSIELYYEPKDSLKVEPTYRYTKEIFDFMEDEIGVPYPWQNYKQVPVQDFLYAGMENTTCTIFSNQYVIDTTAFVDKNYVNVNAHELAHQWFGDLVTEKSGSHHWLQEGFATYYAYLAEKQVFGDDYFYWKLYKTAQTLHRMAENGEGQALTNPKASSLTFYDKGAWALLMLQDEVGEVAFKKGIQNYLKKYQYKNVTIIDFLKEIKLASGKETTSFKEKWLESKKFPWEEVKEKLRQESKTLALVFEMEDKLEKAKSDDLDYEYYWEKTSSINFRQYLIEQYHNILPTSVLDKAFATNTIEIRRALSASLLGISNQIVITDKLKNQFETLLEDESYITIENALIKLWSNFPKKRNSYLSKTKDIIGLPNKNVRLLWLTLALVTEDYEPENKKTYYEELNSYTLAENNFEVRLLAFQYLSQIQALSDASLVNLIAASNHHVWQFKKSSRNLLKEISENNAIKMRLLQIAESLSIEQQNALKKLINQ